MKKIIKPVLLAVVLSSATSCNKFLDITPTGEVIPQDVRDFRALLTRAYEIYPSHKALTGLKSDEVKTTSTSESLQILFTWEDANPGSSLSKLIPYENFYATIFHTNYIIENAPQNILGTNEYNSIMGEAYALRAYTYFELINLYAPAYNSSNGSVQAVPLITIPDLERDFPKESLDTIYAQILSDIESAKGLLSSSQPEGYNYRFTTTALYALKARIHQYRGEWDNALTEANNALALNSKLEDLNTSNTLPSSFKSVESIMNLDKAMDNETHRFSRASDKHIALFDQTNDLRFTKYFIPNGSNWQTTKYNDSNEFRITFRVGEVMLIKAEAEYKSGNEAESKNTLLKLAEKRYNAIGLTNFTTKINSLSGNAYYAELLNERARETSFEGLRWFDLRRTTQPEITHIFDGKTYTLKEKDPRYTIPFPLDARLKNPKL